MPIYLFVRFYIDKVNVNSPVENYWQETWKWVTSQTFYWKRNKNRSKWVRQDTEWLLWSNAHLFKPHSGRKHVDLHLQLDQKLPSSNNLRDQNQINCSKITFFTAGPLLQLNLLKFWKRNFDGDRKIWCEILRLANNLPTYTSKKQICYRNH